MFFKLKQYLHFFLLALTCVLPLTALEAQSQETVAGYPAAEALRLGEVMYRDGILPSGKPMTALVQGDIEITGTMTTCSNCHLRSGLGALEGGILSPPTNGKRLYAPLTGMQDLPGSFMKRSMFKSPRPAYNDETLANCLLSGKSSTGKEMSATMPRYQLDADATKIMVNYLKHLSSQYSPGVTEDEVRFATVVTDSLSAADKNALILPLQAFIEQEWNARLSEIVERQVARLYAFNKRPAGKYYRKLSLEVWELKGPRETWGKQLEAFYRQKPVFALLGGMVPGSWAPVHTFCEDNRIPCVMPVTNQPVVSDKDWYTLYFSKGLYQEGETAAKYLSRVVDLPAGKQVVQIYRDDQDGQTLSRGFSDAWQRLGNPALQKLTLPPGEETGPEYWKKLAARYPNSVLLAWLPAADLIGVEQLVAGSSKPSTLFLSATLLGAGLSSLPEPVRAITLLTYPSRLPDDDAYPRAATVNWLKFKKLPTTNIEMSAKSYLLTRILSRVLIDLGNDYYRDFFLDILDDGRDETTSSLSYPILSFGAGQRYASKGCYVVSLSKGATPKVQRQSAWVIY